MPNIIIHLLGQFNIYYHQTKINTIKSQRLMELLVYLLLHRGVPQTRTHLAYLLWPDSSETQARTNLRNLVYLLRKNLPIEDDFLFVDNQYIGWEENPDLDLDIEKFEKLVNQAEKFKRADDFSHSELVFEQATELYHGDLFPSCYADWIVQHRNHFSQLYVRSLEYLITLKENRNDYYSAIEVARRLLDYDFFNEENQRQLMRLYAFIGNRVAALRIYNNFSELLQRELKVKPSNATQQLYKQLMVKDLQPQRQRPALDETPSAPSLVGRKKEWNQILAIWKKVSEGKSQFILFTGETGIGKTRLGEEMIRWVSLRGFQTFSVQCFSADNRLSFAPIIAQLRSRPLPELDGIWLTEISRLLPDLLVNRPDLPKPVPMIDKWQRQILFEALARSLLESHLPILMFFDNLQWIDEESIEWLYYLFRFDRNLPLLILGTLHPYDLMDREHIGLFLNAIHRSGQLTEIELQALTEEQTVMLAKNLSNIDVTSFQGSQLFRETEGNPLFITELIRSRWISNHKTQTSTENDPSLKELPPRVQSAIEERLAVLSTSAREVVEIAALIGSKFSFDELSKASGMQEESFVKALDELSQRRILRDTSPGTYFFSHSKLRDIIFTNLSPVRRFILRRRVAQAVQMINPMGEFLF